MPDISSEPWTDLHCESAEWVMKGGVQCQSRVAKNVSKMGSDSNQSFGVLLVGLALGTKKVTQSKQGLGQKR